ncbi:MAG: helix-turn-helix domain-containing protein [Gammaproteobacteria bacterium]|nr:MAG: helix-turn-helix domain-containing protein [Gammaproteobacteria bacterium]
MDKVVARKLRPWEGRMLHRLKRQLSNTVNSRHARVILLSRGGLCNREITERVGYTAAWVRQIIRRFNDGGPGRHHVVPVLLPLCSFMAILSPLGGS